MHKYYCLNLWVEDNNHDDSDKNGALSTATSPAQEFCTTTRSRAVYCSLVTSKAETFPIIIIVFTISGALKESSRRCWLMLIKFSFNLFSSKQDHLRCGLSLSISKPYNNYRHTIHHHPSPHNSEVSLRHLLLHLNISLQMN